MKYFKDFDLTEYNSYKIKATCKEAYFPENESDIEELFKNGLQNKTVLGSGHNIIFSKNYYEQPFVVFSNTFDKIEVENNNMVAESGCTMLELSEIALENSLSGLEIFYDIPSSLGGAIVMNAGASGEEIKDVVKKVRYFDLTNGGFATKEKSELDFIYRNSFFQNNPSTIITKVFLELKHENASLIHDKMVDIKSKRWAKQPRDFPNAGSVFKRPKGYFVGTMVEELGLKGTTIGGAQVSKKHAGFIINNGNASGSDILNLIQLVKDKVNKTYGVDLEIEQRII